MSSPVQRCVSPERDRFQAARTKYKHVLLNSSASHWRNLNVLSIYRRHGKKKRAVTILTRRIHGLVPAWCSRALFSRQQGAGAKPASQYKLVGVNRGNMGRTLGTTHRVRNVISGIDWWKLPDSFWSPALQAGARLSGCKFMYYTRYVLIPCFLEAQENTSLLVLPKFPSFHDKPSWRTRGDFSLERPRLAALD